MELSFFTAEPISANRCTTPEGFLICRDVAIARTGTMAYGAGETPVRVNDRGFALVERTEDEVFNPASMDSLDGKAVTDDHPICDVTPANWSLLSKGHVRSPRRGTGDKADLLLADVVIADAAMIQKVRDGKCEVSCGYIANYVEDGVGRGRQTGIRYNHLAVVDKGRCGERCRIGDRHPGPLGYEESDEMSTRDKRLKALTTLDADGLKKLYADLPAASQVALDAALKKFKDVDEDGDDDDEGDDDRRHHIEIHNHAPTDDRAQRRRARDADEDDEDKDKKTEDRITKNVTAGVLDALKKAGVKFKDIGEPSNSESDGEGGGTKADNDLEIELPPGSQRMSQDAQLQALVRDNAALANAMAPGIQLPTLDSTAAKDPKRVLDAVCSMRRSALKVALNRPETIVLAQSLVRDAATVDKMTCGDIRAGFRAVGESARLAQQTRDAASVTGLPPGTRPRMTGAGMPAGKITSPADFNKMKREHYKDRLAG